MEAEDHIWCLMEEKHMINVWDYNADDAVIITCTDGAVIAGIITSIDDEDDSELGEDGISIFTEDGRYIGLGQSEIKEVEIL